MQTINNATTTIKEIWSYQHPVMHTWKYIYTQTPKIKQELRIKVLVFCT